MGRKIPGRKHRGVRDPEKQQAERFAKIKDKVNAPPTNPDDQQVSCSLSRFIELKNKVKQGLFNKNTKTEKQGAEQQNGRRLKGKSENQGSEHQDDRRSKRKPEKQIPKFEQRPGESDRQFKYRVNRICADYLKESAFEDKYGVDVKRNAQGDVEAVVKRPKDELELLARQLKKEKKLKTKSAKKKAKESDKSPKLTKSQKWALKKRQKKEKKNLESNENYSYLPLKEQVRFGDVAHAPPTLVAPKRGEKAQGAPRPGQKNLLLKAMLPVSQTNKLSNKQIKNKVSKGKGVSKTSKVIDKKGKRKDLPHALRRQLDKQQKEIMEVYKTLKSKKYSS